MILKQFTVNNVGPFSEPTLLALEPDVTVLTGANDSGKSSALTAIELICGMTSNTRVLTENDVNLDEIGRAKSPWDGDLDVCCDVLFETTEHSGKCTKGDFEPGTEISAVIRLAPKVRRIEDTKFRRNSKSGWSSNAQVIIQSMPKVIRLPVSDQIRSVIDLTAPNESEIRFLRAAFGPEFNYDKYSALTDSSFYPLLSKAQGDANAKLRRILPPSFEFEFYFHNLHGERNQLVIQLRDIHAGHTPLAYRGTGVQRAVSLIGELLANESDQQHSLILIDEPETSLHADAQHAFRRLLESLAEQPQVQVVYATHSPSMINSVRPHSIRVLRRTTSGDAATSVVDDRPVDGNFLAVRSSLGISAGDSLLWAAVTVIVEGPSEVLGLPIILERLRRAEVEGFGDVNTLLSQVHFLDGCGDSFDRHCQLAVSQGTKPVVFLDGDKAGSRLNKLRRKCPEVPIVLLEGREEFEELVSPEAYFASLSGVMAEFSEDAVESLTQDRFEAWEKDANLPAQMVFSKRIDRWVEDAIGLSVEKPLVMKNVLTDVPVTEVKTGPLKELVDTIRNELYDSES